MKNRPMLRALCFASTALYTLSISAQSFAASPAPATKIEHVIIVVGENHTFDNIFGAYKPKHGQKIDNLLSKGVINEDGTPGPHFHLARQRIGEDRSQYLVETPAHGAYRTLPRPYTTEAIGLPAGAPDIRFPDNLPNGPYQITKYVPFAQYTPGGPVSYTGDPVHRFFQMWQDWDGGKLDKFVWVAETIGTGSDGIAPPLGGFNPKQGAISMGFFNMNPYRDAQGRPHHGDAPIFKALADHYAISDNYHQAVMGGTGANFQAIVTGHAAFFTDPTKLDGSAATPYGNQIENPNPYRGTNNYYTQDGYSGGSYVSCADPAQPGVRAIDEELRKNGVRDNKCVRGHYYLVNNYNMYWDETHATARPLGANSFVLPPQTAPTIADVMTTHGVSWKYYSADRGDDKTSFATSVDGTPLFFHSYCGICDPLTGYRQIMEVPSEEKKLQNYKAFLDDLQNDALPAVAFVRPFEALAGHPADSTVDLYERFLNTLIERVQKSKTWESTAIFITVDEGGGYHDSGYIQPVDFFGDGTRVPFVLVSKWAKKGYVDHTYYDHVSMLKFIEKNWRLPTISALSRDNLPNPVMDGQNAYAPQNIPAIGDLMNLFAFGETAKSE